MLHFLLYGLKTYFKGIELLRYVTFRVIGISLTAFLLSLILGHYYIKISRRYNIGQKEREYGPQTHLKKEGTPTMGGIFFILSTLISALLWCKLENIYTWIMIGGMLSFGIVGFIDDYKKLLTKKGLSIPSKYLLLSVVSLLLIAILFINPNKTLDFFELYIPFLPVKPGLNPIQVPGELLLILYYFILVGATNAVNLTDGIDGLAAGLSIIALIPYGIFAYISSNVLLVAYLKMPFVKGAEEIAVFLAGFIGSITGFLWYNIHPAQVFMGDTGSLSIGGILGLSAILTKQELSIIIIAGIFIVEAISVALQIFVYRTFNGKRLFKMSPLHHHLELSGWSEPQVVTRLWIMGIILSLIGLSIIKIR